MSIKLTRPILFAMCSISVVFIYRQEIHRRTRLADFTI